MESYSLTLQLRAAQEVVSEEMPRRALVAKVILFGEVASALLMIQLGQLTHAGLIAVPFFLTALMAIPREHWSRSAYFPDPRSILVSVLSPKHYSIFGLRRRQKGVATFVWSMILLRVLCLVPLAVTLPGECANPACLFHGCQFNKPAREWRFISQEVWDRRADCQWPAEWPSWNLWNGKVRNPQKPHSNSFYDLVDKEKIINWCERNEKMMPHVPSTFFHNDDYDYYLGFRLAWPINDYKFTFTGLCSEDLNLVPAMARHNCIAGNWDPMLYQSCLKNAWLTNICNGQFLICVYLNGRVELQGVLVLVYILIPGTALILMVAVHLVVSFLGKFSTMHVQEDSKLRRMVYRRSAQLQEQLKNGQLDDSLWWSRRILESKLLFFAADVVLDGICCVNFFRAEAYEFGACQLVVIIVSACLQFWHTNIRTIWKALGTSWQTGLANNVVHVLLLQEKTFEAPLSLYFQFYSAFYVNEELSAFVSLWLSMLFSIVGIANGLYIQNHLTPFDLEMLEEEELPKAPPAMIGLPSWPNDQSIQGIQGMQAMQMQGLPRDVVNPGMNLPPPPPPTPGLGFTPLPSPPGLGFTPSGVQKGRKPGQYVSDTE